MAGKKKERERDSCSYESHARLAASSLFEVFPPLKEKKRRKKRREESRDVGGGGGEVCVGEWRNSSKREWPQSISQCQREKMCRKLTVLTFSSNAALLITLQTWTSVLSGSQEGLLLLLLLLLLLSTSCALCCTRVHRLFMGACLLKGGGDSQLERIHKNKKIQQD